MRKLFKNKKGQGLVEYGILVGGIALVSLAATAILGHKTNDLIATVAAALPCAHEDETGPIVSGKLVATTSNEDGGLIHDANSPGSIEDNLGIENIGSLVLEAGHH
ncbi:MAG: Flp family type IVb pilin [Rhodopirellula sp. JB055]|uniref:Flp family type IVb pilin n=1 Tax=Rhodopirellula sp. JB055 TaxID=3342846 RepID=UPI00370C8A99